MLLKSRSVAVPAGTSERASDKSAGSSFSAEPSSWRTHPLCRVRRCCCQHPLPSELHGRHFDACSSSIEQRPCEIRPGAAPPAHDISYGTRLPHWPWGQPGRYYGRAGYRNRRGPHQRGSLRSRRQICFAPRAGWLSVHGRQHPREVSPLSRGVMSQPLSGPLQAGVRFLPRPLPAAPSVRLTVGLPSREGYGFTTLHRGNLRGLGPASTPVAHHLRRMKMEHPDLATYRFGPSLSASLACLFLRRVRQFTWVDLTTLSWAPTALVLAVATSAHASVAIPRDEDTLSRGLRTPPLPATHASIGDCWQNSRCRHLLWKSNTFPAIPSCRTQADIKRR